MLSSLCPRLLVFKCLIVNTVEYVDTFLVAKCFHQMKERDHFLDMSDECLMNLLFLEPRQKKMNLLNEDHKCSISGLRYKCTT